MRCESDQLVVSVKSSWTTSQNVDRKIERGENICRFAEEHDRAARLLSRPLEEYLPSASEDELLHKIASNPIHAFKLIYRLRRCFMGKVLPMIRTKWPKGITNTNNLSLSVANTNIQMAGRDVSLRTDLLQLVETRKSETRFPNDADLHGMAVSLNRIQSIYSLDVRDLAKVRISKNFSSRLHIIWMHRA